MLLVLLRLIHLHLVHLDALGWGVAQSLDLSVVVLHLYLFKPLIGDLTKHRVLSVGCVGSASRTNNLRRSLG